MDYYSKQINQLVEALSMLPGIGSKTAQRLAFHILSMPKEDAERLANSITQARNNVRYCKQCFTLTDDELCPICRDEKRDHKVIMVVENTRDLAAYEKTGKFEGVYHVLHGAISPMQYMINTLELSCTSWGHLTDAWHRAGGYPVKGADAAIAR